jgi:hypothetical protein
MVRVAAIKFRPSLAWSVPGVLAAAAVAVATSADADVYKCKGDGDTPVYQESPCPPGKQLRNFQTDPPEITVLPGRQKGGNVPPAKAAATPEKPATAEKAAKPDPGAKGKFDPAERASARVGMSESEVLAKFGPPDVTSNSPSRRQLRWTWLPADGDPDMVTTVTITDGIVTDLERRTVKK